MNVNHENISIKTWIGGELKKVRISEMDKVHRERYKGQLLRFAKDRKDGLNSLWYDTGMTIGELCAVLGTKTGSKKTNSKKKVFVRSHYRTV